MSRQNVILVALEATPAFVMETLRTEISALPFLVPRTCPLTCSVVLLNVSQLDHDYQKPSELQDESRHLTSNAPLPLETHRKEN